MIYFITSNKNKLAEMWYVLNMEIEQMEIDLPETQTTDPEKVFWRFYY